MSEQLLRSYTCVADSHSPFRPDGAVLQSSDLPTQPGVTWLDVSPKADPSEVTHAFSSLGIAVSAAEVKLLGASKDRPRPQLVSAASDGAAMRFWAFGASVEDAVESEVLLVLLQPVGLLVQGNVVVTWRQPGVRFRVDHYDHPPTLAPPMEAERLLSASGSALVPLVQAGGTLDRDALFFAILEGLVVTQFNVRATLGQAKVAFDNQYFKGLLDSRRQAAEASVRSQDVAQAAIEASQRIDRSRAALGSIQSVTTVWRRWFDDFKPPGLPFKESVWLPATTQPAASSHLVDRIYQVRNDLRYLRAEVHQSMALLATADTGGQLLAIRALLDRTESARNAAVVAAAITLIIATIGLSAAVAAIPSTDARFLPFSKALGIAGVAILGSVVVGGLVALLSRRSPPLHRRAWNGFTLALFGTSVVAVVLAVVDLAQLRVAFLIGSVVLAIAALLTAAYAGDFGEQPQMSDLRARSERARAR
jgi:hypothetical protein